MKRERRSPRPGIFSELRATFPRRSAPVLCFVGLFLSTGCKPAPSAGPDPATQEQSHNPYASASVVSIPDEFWTTPAPAPTPPASKPLLPRVVFATSDFQVTTHHGIQGIRAGEAVNFLREDGGDYVVEYGGVEFKKNKTYFAATYVAASTPVPTPPASDPEPTPDTIETSAASTDTALPGESPLSGTVPDSAPPTLADDELRAGELTDSIRKLNEKIRVAQDALDKKSTIASKGGDTSAAEMKKEARAILRLKAERDALSGQLTEIGKP